LARILARGRGPGGIVKKLTTKIFRKKYLTNRAVCGIIYTERESEVLTMMTYIIEVGVPGMPFWELEKVRANSLSEAKAYLREIYGPNAFFGHSKAVY
jgi:hypothetical protein